MKTFMDVQVNDEIIEKFKQIWESQTRVYNHIHQQDKKKFLMYFVEGYKFAGGRF